MTSILMGKAPLTLVRTQHGSVEYVYGGHVAPAGIVKEDLDRLLDEGFLVEVEVPEEVATEVEEPDGSDDRPALTATKDVWLDYRRGQDIPDQALVGLTKQELQDDDFVAGLRPQP